MLEGSDSFLPTRWSLVQRLKDLDDQVSWQEFFDTYWRIVHRAAIQAGLTQPEAQDVVQETLISVAKQMKTFRAGPELGSFKAWLQTITRRRIVDQYRRRAREPKAGLPLEETGQTDTIAKIPDPASLMLDDYWEAEWERNLVAAATERLKHKIKLKHLQAYDMLVAKKMSGSEVARLLNLNLATVYLIRHRVGKLMREETQRLRHKFK